MNETYQDIDQKTIPDAQLTHVGIYVQDLEKMVVFYTQTLGLLVNDLGEINGRRLAFLSRTENEHHQVVLAWDPERKRSGDSTLNQVSFRVASLEKLREMFFFLSPKELPGMEARNHGNSWSFYFFDPEGNKIEIYAVTQWQVQQPWRISLDLTRPTADIEKETEELVKTLPSWQALDDWKAAMRKRLGKTQ